ncbi:hypothetical protein PTKIN_Ptkin15bG0031900 [Pterospermum kingtungense]
MEAYKTWVRRNRDYVHSLESLANGLTWLLPERFSTSEIGPEAVTAFLGILTAVNEHIIDTAPNERHTGSADPSSFPYGLMIVILALFRNSGYKMLLHGGETPNVEKDPDHTSSQHRIGRFAKPEGHHGPGWLGKNHGQNPWNHEGRALFALSRFGESARMISDPVWMQRIQQQRAIIEPPTSIIKRPTLSMLLSEKGVNGALFVLGEVRRRKLLWALYLMREPFFSKYTRQKLESTETILEPVPLIGTLAAKIIELVVGAQTR